MVHKPSSLTSLPRCILGVSASLLFFTGGVAAQTSPLVIEEIVITSTKRETNLSDTAVSASVFSSEKLTNLQISNGTDYEALVPSLSFREGPATRIFIRGVGRVSNNLGIDPGVAVYDDGIYNAEAELLNSGTLNQERVEILRGPQGTLFGRNATGGTFSSFSKRPTRDFDAAVRVSGGNYDSQSYQALVRGPINDTMGYKFYTQHRERDGYFDNVGNGKDGGADNTDTYEGQFQWDVSEEVEFWVKYVTLRYDRQTQPSTLLDPYTSRPEVPIVLSAQAGQIDNGIINPGLNDDREYRVDDIGQVRLRDNDQWTTHLTWNQGDFQLKYIGGYNRFTFTSLGNDVDGTDNPDRRRINDIGQFSRLYSHELQLTSTTSNPLQYVVGLYTYHEDNEQPVIFRSLSEDNIIAGEPTQLTINGDIPNTGTFFAQNGILRTDSYSAYGEVTYQLNDEWQFVTGLRYSKDKKEGFEQQEIRADLARVTNSPDLMAPAINVNPTPNIRDKDQLDEDFNSVSGRVIVNYTPNDNNLIYGSVSSGYKPGGFRLGSLQDIPSFDEETVLAYELGWKGLHFDDTLQLDAALYFYDYSDNQVLRNFTDPVSGIVLSSVENVDVDIFGLELESVYLVSDNLSISANYSYTDSEFDTDKLFADNSFPEGTIDPLTGALADEVDGNPTQQTPRNKLTFLANYQMDTRVGQFAIRPTLSYVGARNFDIFDNRETRADSYVRFDMQATWTNNEGNIIVRLQGRNLNDEDIVNSIDGNNVQQRRIALAPPRNFSLELEYQF